MVLRTWLASSLVRHFPQTPAPQAGRQTKALALDAARNERMSFQVALRLEAEDAAPQTVRVEVEETKGLSVRVRRVGYVPVRHRNTPSPIPYTEADLDGAGEIPGYVPDPLFDENSLLLPGGETHAFWITVRPNPGAAAGDYSLRVRVVPETGKAITHTATIRLHDVLIKKRRDFSITHWFYIDALMDFYGTDHCDERFWTITERYMRNMAEHGQDTVLVPVFTPPLDGVKRPSQLLQVRHTGSGSYEFDWSDVRKYIALASQCGISHFEWAHLFTQWGAANAIRIYERQGQDEKLLWPPETGATSGIYRDFLAQYLPALKDFLTEEKLLKKSFFHVSDEPHGEEHIRSYRQAREMLHELAPWMKVMDALSEIEFGRQKLTDLPIPSIETALDFVGEDIPCWCYYCCFPRGAYLNRLLDTPLPKIAMHGFVFYRWPLQGFLHWGYNYWYKQGTRHMIEPLSVQDGHGWPNWAYGDTFLVYPGPDGPIDSIRWEIFAESMQDYALLQTLGVDRNSKLLGPIRSFTDFPKVEKWRQTARKKLLKDAKESLPAAVPRAGQVN